MFCFDCEERVHIDCSKLVNVNGRTDENRTYRCLECAHYNLSQNKNVPFQFNDKSNSLFDIINSTNEGMNDCSIINYVIQ